MLGTSRSDEKLQTAEELGLDEGFNTQQSPAWASLVKQQTRGEGADLIVEVGGAATLSDSMKAV